MDVSPRTRLRRTAVGLLRLLVVLVRALTDPRLNLEATALVYRTLLSIVPLLAVSFSVLKAFGQPQGHGLGAIGFVALFYPVLQPRT